VELKRAAITAALFVGLRVQVVKPCLDSKLKLCFNSPSVKGGEAMAKGKASGYTLKAADAPTIFGMIARGDRDHDIAAWFGVNQGRIAEVKDGSKFGIVAAAPAGQLPPKGAPGIKGRRLKDDVDRALAALQSGDAAKALTTLVGAKGRYEKNEA
jgi:hypothetical protein